jgi:hypothetical protein
MVDADLSAAQAGEVVVLGLVGVGTVKAIGFLVVDPNVWVVGL